MPNFMESPRFPDQISWGVSFGPEFVTNIATNESGSEQRDKKRDRGLCVGECSHAVKSQDELTELLTFFRSVKGRWTGFRFKDWADYRLVESDSYFELVSGTVNQYQLGKKYEAAVGYSEIRQLLCPITSTFLLYDSASLVATGAGAGEYTVDENGVVTFVASQTRSISSHVVGANHKLVLSSALSPNIVVGQQIVVSGITGTSASLLNDILHTVTIVSGTDITINASTTGLTASSGTATLYRQKEDLTASCEFDVPCRFDTDRMAANLTAYNSFSWGQIPIQEIRRK